MVTDRCLIEGGDLPIPKLDVAGSTPVARSLATARLLTLFWPDYHSRTGSPRSRRKPGDGSPDGPDLTGCPGDENRSAVRHALPYMKRTSFVSTESSEAFARARVRRSARRGPRTRSS
jgi:hypothetical protein